MRPRRLVLLFDGTWNKREDTTNVWRMRALLRNDSDQCLYYDEGVGTQKGEKIGGGVFGTGISSKVLAGYLWLVENYESASESPRGLADEVFIFGFSRGATCARSLVGLLSIVGLLHLEAATRIRDAFELSRTDGIDESHAISRDFRARNSRPIRIKFLGVWDTVMSLGIPGYPDVKLPSFEYNAMHKVVELPSIVDNARHALAIDERRALFDATLWPESQIHQSMEQRWFIGAHANVGGGYDRDGLFRRPLQWLQQEAITAGLEFRKYIVDVGAEFYGSSPRDSLGDAKLGLYYLTQKLKPFDRQIKLGGRTNEYIDYTVLERWLWDPTYEPPPLRPIFGPKVFVWLASPRLTDPQLQKLLPGLHSSGTRGFRLND